MLASCHLAIKQTYGSRARQQVPRLKDSACRCWPQKRDTTYLKMTNSTMYAANDMRQQGVTLHLSASQSQDSTATGDLQP